jgi:hypothetical protein
VSSTGLLLSLLIIIQALATVALGAQCWVFSIQCSLLSVMPGEDRQCFSELYPPRPDCSRSFSLLFAHEADSSWT